MALPAKERFKKAHVNPPLSVALTRDGEPISVGYKHASWPSEKMLTVLGISLNDDLMDHNIPMSTLAVLASAKQYILGDAEANLYEAFIEVTKKGSEFTGLLKTIKSTPSE